MKTAFSMSSLSMEAKHDGESMSFISYCHNSPPEHSRKSYRQAGFSEKALSHSFRYGLQAWRGNVEHLEAQVGKDSLLVLHATPKRASDERMRRAWQGVRKRLNAQGIAWAIKWERQQNGRLHFHLVAGKAGMQVGEEKRLLLKLLRRSGKNRLGVSSWLEECRKDGVAGLACYLTELDKDCSGIGRPLAYSKNFPRKWSLKDAPKDARWQLGVRLLEAILGAKPSKAFGRHWAMPGTATRSQLVYPLGAYLLALDEGQRAAVIAWAKESGKGKPLEQRKGDAIRMACELCKGKAQPFKEAA